MWVSRTQKTSPLRLRNSFKSKSSSGYSSGFLKLWNSVLLQIASYASANWVQLFAKGKIPVTDRARNIVQKINCQACRTTSNRPEALNFQKEKVEEKTCELTIPIKERMKGGYLLLKCAKRTEQKQYKMIYELPNSPAWVVFRAKSCSIEVRHPERLPRSK